MAKVIFIFPRIGPLLVSGSLLLTGAPAVRAQESAAAPPTSTLPPITPTVDDSSEPPPQTITLRELLRAARRNPPAVLSALATLKRVEAEQSLAEAAYLPRVTGEATLGMQYDNRRVLPSQPRLNSTSVLATTAFTVDWTAVDFGRKNSIESARAASVAQTLGVKVSERSAMLAAAELYLHALAASELVADAELSVQRRAQQQEAIGELSRAGVRPSVDALRAGVELTAARYVSEMRRIEELASFAALAVAVGEEPERGLRPAALPEGSFDGPNAVREISALAREQRPELKQLREQIRVQQEAYAAAVAERWPIAGLFASGQASYYGLLQGAGIEGDQYGASAGMYARWNAADPGVFRLRKVAEGKLMEVQRQLQASELSIRGEAVETAYAAQRSRAQLEQAEQVLEAARATRTAQHERYGAGMASLLELLDAEALEQTARRSRIEAVRDNELARARVLGATGTVERLAD